MVGRYGIQPAQAGENIVEIDEQGAFHAWDNELDAAILAHGPVANCALRVLTRLRRHMQQIVRQLAAEIKVTESQVRAAVELLDGGATVPFIARYRKEVTGGLDDV